MACPSIVWPTGFLLMVVIVGGSAVVVHVLVVVLLVQRQLTRLGLVGVVVAVVLRVDHKRTIKVGLYIAASFPWVGHLGRGNRVADRIKVWLKRQTYLK